MSANVIKLGYKAKARLFYTLFCGVGVGNSVVTISLNTFLKEKYATPFHAQKEGRDFVVSEKLKGMFSNCSDDLRAPIFKPPSTLFHCIGFDNMHFGSTMTTTGASIGLPISYTFNSVKDVDIRSIQISGKDIDWQSPEGKDLLESFVMSDSAKKFGIAYELALVNSGKLYAHVGVGPIVTAVCAFLNNYFCDVYGLHLRPLIIKGAFYLCLALFGIGVFCMLKDSSTQYFEYQALNDVAEAGEEYVKGGIEYFDKLLTRNKILRNIVTGGTSEYTSTGNVAFFFRKKHFEISELKKLLEEKQSKPEELQDVL